MTPHETPWETLGLRVGHDTDHNGATGCTVVRGHDRPMVCAAALLGRASATRELGTCEVEHLVQHTDAILLTGGSAYGLDAAAGVMQWMEEQGRGFPVGDGVVPIVPAAAIFDLAPLGRFDARPSAHMAYRACASATARDIAEGSVGAGTGATVGKAAGPAASMKGGVGLGSASGGGGLVAAVAVVNAFGDVRDGTGQIIAGARRPDGGMLDTEAALSSGALSAGVLASAFPAPGRQHTTIACVAVNAVLSKLELAQLATAATAALRQRITPCATAYDGDVVFAVGPATGPSVPVSVPTPVLEALAVRALAEAIERAVRTARGRDGVPGLAGSS